MNFDHLDFYEFMNFRIFYEFQNRRNFLCILKRRFFHRWKAGNWGFQTVKNSASEDTYFKHYDDFEIQKIIKYNKYIKLNKTHKIQQKNITFKNITSIKINPA